MRTDENIPIRIGVIVGIVTLLVYSGALSCGFINLDDPFYITNNQLIKHLDLSSLLKIFTEAHLGAWLPLTYLSFAVDYHFWGNDPFGYHLTNNLLHAANASLVVLLADRIVKCIPVVWIEGRYQYPVTLLLAGLLWGIHPLRVESVAWAAERKDVLNGIFTLAAVIAYLTYARRKTAVKGPTLSPYLLAVAFFILSLLAKQVSVTLPVILLLLDWYPLGRLAKGEVRALLLEKAPFFAISLLVTVVTIYFAAAENTLVPVSDMPLYVRALVSGNAIIEYCRLTLFPVGVSPYFVLPKPLPYGYLVKTVIAVAITCLLLRSAPRRPAAAVTWFSFIILLAPVLAFVQAGDDIAMAARYTYLAAIPPAIASARLVPMMVGKMLAQGRRLLVSALFGAVAVYLGCVAVLTVRLVRVWQDTGAFWTRVIEIDPVGRAYGDRGVYYLITGNSAAAVDDFTVAINIAVNANVPSVYNLYAFRGVALSDSGRYAEAIPDFDRAIAFKPHPAYFQLRGTALKALGRAEEAERDFRNAGPNPSPIDWF